MNRVSIALALLLLFPIPRGAGQTSLSSNFLEQAAKLQSVLGEWREGLAGIDFSLLQASDAELQLLRQDRSASLKWINIVESDLRNVEGRTTLEGQLRLVGDIGRLQGAVSNLQDSFGEMTRESQPPMFTRINMTLETVSASLGYPLFQELNALSAATQTALRAAQRPGEVSGHIYRADTGRPLAGVTVALILNAPASPLRIISSAKTTDDGSYEFSGVVPDNYELMAHQKGFARAYYHHGQNGYSSPLHVTSGAKLNGIDLKLHPVVNVTQMNTMALIEAYPETGFSFRSAPGRFSPDGSLFAVVVDGQQVWLYDLKAQRLIPATVKPPLTSGLSASIIGWAGDTLYAKDSYGHGLGPTRFFAVTAEATKEIPHLPPGVKYTSGLIQGCESGSPCAQNNRFVLTLKDLGHGDLRLTARTTDGRETFQIPGGN